MFKHVGRKVKVLAVITFVIELIGAVITAFSVGSLMKVNGGLYGLLIVIGGFVAAYISVLSLYALGEAAEGAEIIKQMQAKNKENQPTVECSDTPQGEIQCPYCGIMNDASRVICKSCYSKLRP